MRSSLVLVVALCLAFAAPGHAQVFGPAAPLPANAAGDTGLDQQPMAATDGQSTWLAVWSSREDLAGNGTDGDILVARSVDGGVTWSAPVLLNTNATADAGLDSTPAIATDGTTWVAVWTSTDTLGGTIGTDPDLLYARSVDGGVTWSAPLPLDATAAADTVTDSAPKVVTANGTWLTVWNTGRLVGGDFDVAVARSVDGGATWSAPAPLNTNAGGDSGHDLAPSVAADAPGTWVAVWSSTDSLGDTIGTDTDILTTRSVDDGLTWTAPVPVATAASTDSGPDAGAIVAGDGAGTLVVAWASGALPGLGSDVDIVSATSTDGGVTFAPPVPVNANADVDAEDDTQPTVATDGAGTWLAGWVTRVAAGDFDTFVARSYDDAASWSPFEALGRKPLGDGGTDLLPQIVSDRRGTFVAVWESNDPLGGLLGTDGDVLFALAIGADHYDCYQARSTPGATRFPPTDLALEDRFGAVPAVRLQQPRTVCAPASKNGESVADPTAHLTCYSMRDAIVSTPFRATEVAVWNQFGAQRLQVKKPYQLCVPSEKNGVASALRIDHYRCYKAKFQGPTPFPPTPVTLADQFQTRAFTVAPCVRFCAPVGVEGDEIRAPAAHLTCYRLQDAGVTPPFARVPVTVENELGSLDLTVRPLLDLCVPTLTTVLP